MELQQDYTLYTDAQRTQHVANLLHQPSSAIAHIVDDYARSGKDITDESVGGKALSQLADYILFGKDPEKLTNAVQRKEISKPDTLHNYSSRKLESLDELMEQPGFDQRQYQTELQKNSYTHPKPTINNYFLAANASPRGQTIGSPACCLHSNCPWHDSCCQGNEAKQHDCDAWIPTMASLWDSIAKFQHLLRLAAKKDTPRTDAEERAVNWDSLTQYRVKHWLIDLRKHQYYLKEGYRPTLPCGFGSTAPGAIDWESDACYPETITLAEAKDHPEAQWDEEGVPYLLHMIQQHTLDLTNPNHIYHLLLLYDELWKDSWDKLEGQMKWILDALDEIGRRTELSPAQDKILELRVLKWTNDRISQEIKRLYGLDYNPNYLSIIFKRNICTKLADTAKLMQREFAAPDDDEHWKRCSCCGRRLLIDDYNFVKKSGTRDGFSARCKRCDAVKRRELGRGDDKNGE